MYSFSARTLVGDFLVIVASLIMSRVRLGWQYSVLESYGLRSPRIYLRRENLAERPIGSADQFMKKPSIISLINRPLIQLIPQLISRFEISCSSPVCTEI